jgi:hypothetical protein
VKELENRVAWLETHVQSNQPSQPPDQSSAGDTAVEGTPDNGSLQTAPNLANSIGYLSLQAAAEPQYFGVSSGVSLALMIETAVYDKARPSSGFNLPSEGEGLFSSDSPRPQTAIIPLPSLEKGASFIDAYLSTIHPNFPFLSKKKLWELHRNGKHLEDGGTDEADLDRVVLQLVYAIGSRCLQLIGAPSAVGVEPEGHYYSAMARTQDKLSVPSIKNIQIMLLVAIYALRSPSGTFSQL